jgi:CRISPR-associated protein Cmr6
MRNLHKAYYKDYFKNLSFGYLLNNGEEPKSEIKSRNKDLTAPNMLEVIPRNALVGQTFELEISYPGLVTGVGINHEAKIEGEFKLGVHFDWVYGMPVVYGSSVKGVLRSYFKEFYKPTSEQPDVKAAFDDIFEGGKKSIYDRDIFFDAVLIKPDKKNRILCSDSITPHGENPLKNPIPITFLKVASGCALEFRFNLVDTQIGELVFKKEDKLRLFREILTTVGIGAKTNVGYGQLK